MKKSSASTKETAPKARDQKNSLSIATADLDTIYAAAQEYLENGYSYPLFQPGCGCD